MIRKLSSAVALMLVAGTVVARGQDRVAPASATPLKVQVVLSRYDGDRKLASMPYTLMVNASDGMTGMFAASDQVWKWYFDANGQLSAGSVPWGRVTGAPAITAWVPDFAANGNTVALRNANGYLHATYLNQSSPNSENGPISQVFINNGGDGFLRKVDLSYFGNSLTVPWRNIADRPGSLSQFNNDSGFVSWNSAPTFSGLVYGRGGGEGLGRITMTNVAGQPSGGAPGDIVFVY